MSLYDIISDLSELSLLMKHLCSYISSSDQVITILVVRPNVALWHYNREKKFTALLMRWLVMPCVAWFCIILWFICFVNSCVAMLWFMRFMLSLRKMRNLTIRRISILFVIVHFIRFITRFLRNWMVPWSITWAIVTEWLMRFMNVLFMRHIFMRFERTTSYSTTAASCSRCRRWTLPNIASTALLVSFESSGAGGGEGGRTCFCCAREQWSRERCASWDLGRVRWRDGNCDEESDSTAFDKNRVLKLFIGGFLR